MRSLLEDDAPSLATLLTPEACGFGPIVTDYLPGQSWHQWGEAADLFTLVDGRAIWDGSPVRLIANLALDVGLYHSYAMKTWTRKSRHWHVQLRKPETPLMDRTICENWRDVEREMSLRYEIKRGEQSVTTQ